MVTALRDPRQSSAEAARELEAAARVAEENIRRADERGAVDPAEGFAPTLGVGLVSCGGCGRIIALDALAKHRAGNCARETTRGTGAHRRRARRRAAPGTRDRRGRRTVAEEESQSDGEKTHDEGSRRDARASRGSARVDSPRKSPRTFRRTSSEPTQTPPAERPPEPPPEPPPSRKRRRKPPWGRRGRSRARTGRGRRRNGDELQGRGRTEAKKPPPPPPRTGVISPGGRTRRTRVRTCATRRPGTSREFRARRPGTFPRRARVERDTGDIPRRRRRVHRNNSDARETPRSRPRTRWCPSRHPPILERSARFDNARCTR